MRMLTTIAAAAAMTAFGLSAAQADRTPAPEGASVYFIAPANGDTVSNPVSVKFGLSGMGVAPAGVENENTGHHHLLVNVPESEIDFDNPLPAYQEASEAVIHFGGGQTETTVELPIGTHELRLLVADHNHVPHDPPVMSETITVIVK